jgi:hypothetical protein
MRAWVALVLGLLACSAPGVEPRPAKDRWLRAPPRPGSSITHTKLCECRVCEPERCCRGETYEPAGESCGDSYDFSKAGCGMAVESCTGRCSKIVWRVSLDEDCIDRAACC